MIRLCTGITQNYLQRAQPYLDSLEEYVSPKLKPGIVTVAPIIPYVFGVGRDGYVDIKNDIDVIPCDYSQVLQLPKFMLQNGAFIRFAPANWRDSDSIAFTDADAILQRPFTSEEIAYMENIDPGDVLIGRNAPDPHQTLLDESTKIMPKVSPATIAKAFPGIDWMKCANCGFVVATLGTWKRIYAEFCRIWRNVDACFDNPAKVQFGVCFVVQNSKEFNLRELPLTIHTHAHLGLPEGVHFHEGKWMHGDHVIAFAHCM